MQFFFFATMSLLLLLPAIDQSKVSDQESSNAEVTENDVSSIEKARRFEEEKAYLEALEEYKTLFQSDPIHYRDLLRISRILNRQKREQDPVLKNAYDRFVVQMERSRGGPIKKWVTAVNELVIIAKLIGNASGIEKLLRDELKTVESEASKEAFLNQQLASVYSDRAAKVGRNASKEAKQKQLEDLTKAINLDDKSRQAKRWLTILGFDETIGDLARSVYDPSKDENTTWLIDSELAHHALKKNQFRKAIELFESARKKQPTSPQILNNLAYTYLQLDTPEPAKALWLVDQAILNMKGIQMSDENRRKVVGSFFDTRGEALKQLGKVKEAAESFEIVLRSRPDDRELLKTLIELYSDIDGNKAEVYRRKIREA